jgi:hypothetical protein
MNKTLLISTFVLLTTPFAWSQSISISRDVFNTKDEPFKTHQGPGAFDTYLTMEVPYLPVNAIYKKIIQRSGVQILTREEAHVTVIGPVEFDKQLRGYIDMNEIDQMAKDLKIQESEFTIVCLGSAEKFKNGKFFKTYYLVLDSPALFNLRSQILNSIIISGGIPTLFIPENYYPHITVGFINDDLHDSDGVFKDASTCVSDVIIE